MAIEELIKRSLELGLYPEVLFDYEYDNTPWYYCIRHVNAGTGESRVMSYGSYESPWEAYEAAFKEIGVL